MALDQTSIWLKSNKIKSISQIVPAETENGVASAELHFLKSMNQEFLPLTINEQRVYVGFWKRFVAGFADFVVLIPFIIFFTWLESIDRNLAIIITIPSTALFALYHVIFNARFGGTLGKLLVGIRITRPDGSPIAWSHAWWRSSVDLAFAFLFLCGNVWALSQIDPMTYSGLDWMMRAENLQQLHPAWFGLVFILQQVWVWSELIVLLFNKRKRAIHDFIAGTVVIKKEFSEPSGGINFKRNAFPS